MATSKSEQKQDMEMHCFHNQAAGTMTCSWLGGRVQLVAHWRRGMAAVVIDGAIKDRFSISEMCIGDFMFKQRQAAEAAVQVAAFERRSDTPRRVPTCNSRRFSSDFRCAGTAQ